MPQGFPALPVKGRKKAEKAKNRMAPPFLPDVPDNDHRYAKTIENSIVFAAKRQVWQPMIQRIIGAMLIEMNVWQNSTAVLLSSKAAR